MPFRLEDRLRELEYEVRELRSQLGRLPTRPAVDHNYWWIGFTAQASGNGQTVRVHPTEDDMVFGTPLEHTVKCMNRTGRLVLSDSYVLVHNENVVAADSPRYLSLKAGQDGPVVYSDFQSPLDGGGSNPSFYFDGLLHSTADLSDLTVSLIDKNSILPDVETGDHVLFAVDGYRDDSFSEEGDGLPTVWLLVVGSPNGEEGPEGPAGPQGPPGADGNIDGAYEGCCNIIVTQPVEGANGTICLDWNIFQDGFVVSESECTVSIWDGCGIKLDGVGAVAVDTADIIGDGLEPGEGECRIQVKAGCGIVVDEEGVSVEPIQLAGRGLIPSPEPGDCKLDIHHNCSLEIPTAGGNADKLKVHEDFPDDQNGGIEWVDPDPDMGQCQIKVKHDCSLQIVDGELGIKNAVFEGQYLVWSPADCDDKKLNVRRSLTSWITDITGFAIEGDTLVIKYARNFGYVLEQTGTIFQEKRVPIKDPCEEA